MLPQLQKKADIKFSNKDNHVADIFLNGFYM